VCERRSVGVGCHDSPDDEAARPSLRTFHTASKHKFSEVRGSNLRSLASGPRGMGPAHSLYSPPVCVRYICSEQSLQAVATCYAPTSQKISKEKQLPKPDGEDGLFPTRPPRSPNVRVTGEVTLVTRVTPVRKTP
jgi:hypothetical protein